jgi:hypothetical protein
MSRQVCAWGGGGEGAQKKHYKPAAQWEMPAQTLLLSTICYGVGFNLHPSSPSTPPAPQAHHA